MRNDNPGSTSRWVAVAYVALLLSLVLLAETAGAGGLSVVAHGRAVMNTPTGGINPWAIETNGSGDIVDETANGIPASTELIVCVVGNVNGRYCTGLTYKPSSSATAINATAVPTIGTSGSYRVSLWYITASQGALGGSYGANGISWSATFSGTVIGRTFQYVALTGLAANTPINTSNDTEEVRNNTGGVTLTETMANLPLGYRFLTGVVSYAGVSYPDPTLTTLTSSLPLTGNFLASGTVVTSRLDIASPGASSGSRSVAYSAGSVGTSGWGVVLRPRYTLSLSANSPGYAQSVTGGGDYDAGTTSAVITATANPGYRFVNWTEGGSAVSTSASYTVPAITADRALVANFIPISSTVTFSTQWGTTPNPTSKTVTYGSTYGALATTSLTGFTFRGWWTGVGGTGTEITSETPVTITSDQTLYAKWTATTDTVTFDAQGGMTPSPTSKTVTYGSAYGTLAATSRTGYTFLGWFTDPAAGTRVLDSTSVTSTTDHTLYAHWAVNTYTVSFDAQGGTAPAPADMVATYDAAYGALPGTSRTGYSFQGWFTASSGGTQVLAGTTVTTATDHTLYAQWTANAFTVTFDAQGGTTPAPASKVVAYDAAYGTLATTSRTGYAFQGWFTEPAAGTQVVETTLVALSADQTLYAHWTVNTYTAAFDAQGGTTPEPVSKVVTYGEAYGTLATTSRTGYAFAGWFTDPSGGTQVLENTTVTTASDHTLYAHWTGNTYTVTFDAQGGTAPDPATKDVTFGANYGGLAGTSRIGYKLTGWFTAASGGSQVTDSTAVTIADHHTLYAQWAGPFYTVTFDAQGGTTPSPVTKEVALGSTYGALAATSREGYTLSGWFTAPSGGTQVLDTMPVTLTSDQTLYANWTVNTYTVTFDAQGGTTPSFTSSSVSYGSPYNQFPTTSRSGYGLIGWFTAPSGGTHITTSTAMTTASDHTLYAHWALGTLTVTFDAQGGATPSPTTKMAASDTFYGPLATTSRTGYDFNGWFTAPSGGSQVLDSTVVTATSDHTLYAQWSVQYYTVTFDAQGGTTPNPTTALIPYGSPYGTLPTTWRTGYGLIGWFTAPSGGTQVTTSTAVTTASDHTLYAHWALGTLTVTFDAQGGATPSPATQMAASDTFYGPLATTSRTGYDFNGWFTAPSGGSQVLDSTVVTATSDHTLYAQWSVHNYTVTFDARGGTAPVPTTKLVAYDSPYGTLPGPTRTGYFLLGWFTAPSGGTQVTASTAMTTASDHTLYAHWTLYVRVRFDPNGGYYDNWPLPGFPYIGVGLNTPYNTYYTFPVALRSGYTFAGWYTASSGGTQVLETTIVTNSNNHTLYAHWTANTYTVTFDAQGGTTPNPTTKVVTYNSQYGALATTSRTNYVFLGWFTAASGGSQVTDSSTVSVYNDHTLYAHWTADTYTVTFDAQGGTTPNPTTKVVTSGSPYGTLATTSRASYVFLGWFTAASGGSQITESSTVSVLDGQTLYAHWAQSTSTVTFDAQGGATPSLTTKSVAYGSPYGALATTSRTGYTFSGWFTGAYNGSQILDTTVVTATGNHTLYAHWTGNTYTVTFDAQGGTAPSPATKVVTFGTIYGTLAKTSRAGFIFGRWCLSPSGDGPVASDSTVATASNHTLYAEWVEDQVKNVTMVQEPASSPAGTQLKITYDLPASSGTCTVSVDLSTDGGTSWPYTATTATGDIGASVSPGTGKTIYWRFTTDYPALSNRNTTNAMVRVAVTGPESVSNGDFATGLDNWTAGTGWEWLPTSRMASFSGDTTGGLWQVASQQAIRNSLISRQRYIVTYTVVYLDGVLDVYLGSTSLNFPAHSAGTYTETIWCGTGASIHISFIEGRHVVLDDISIKRCGEANSARGTLSAFSPTVTFDAQGGTTPEPASKVVTYDTTYGALPGTSRTGYSFRGWFTAPSGGTQVLDGTPVTTTTDHTLFAQWTANAFTVTFDAQGGTTPTPASKVVAYDAAYGPLAVTLRTGYAFQGWFTDPAAGTQVVETTLVTLTSDQTLYAHWALGTYTAAFDAQGGTTPEPVSKVVTHGDAYGTLATTSRTGYVFAGWFTAPSGGTQVLESTAVTAGSDHTLYAHWTGNTYTVTFDAQGGTAPDPATKNVMFGANYGGLAGTSRIGYMLTGWFTAASGGSQVTDSTAVAIASDHTLYAHWAGPLYTVTFDAQGGTTPNPATKEVVSGSSYGTLATTSRVGYTLSGWFTAPSGGTQVTPSTAMTTASDHTLYAHWEPSLGPEADSNNVYWDNSVSSSGPNGGVIAMAKDSSGNVYIGGTFTSVGNVTANYVAKWDGQAWSALGTGMNGGVNALAADGSGNVYAGGDFTTAGGVAASYVAKWDGTAWSALGTGMNYWVHTLAVDGSGNVYAGGYFSTAGGVAASNLAKWNGTAWSALGNQMLGSPDALAVDGAGNLYASSSTYFSGNIPFCAVKKWSGTAWSTLGSQTTFTVNALAVDGSGNVYAGGFTRTPSTLIAHFVAKWNGTAWATLGSEMNNYVYALAVDDSGNVYAGGDFTAVGGVAANRLARWNGTAWAGLGTGTNNTVQALVVDRNTLFAGGAFGTAGGKTSAYFAEWQPRVNRSSALLPASPGVRILGNDVYGFYKPALLTDANTTVSCSGGLPVTMTLSRANEIHVNGIRVNGAFTVGPAGVQFGGSGATLRIEFSEDDVAAYSGASYTDFRAAALTYSSSYPTAKEASERQAISDAVPSAIRVENGKQIYAITVPVAAIGSTYGAVPRAYLTPANPISPGARDIGTNAITWTWTDTSPDETGFKVYDGPGAGAPSTLQFTTAANAQSWQHNGLTPNTPYTFQVAAVYAEGDDQKTTPFTAYTLAATPMAPVVSGATAYSLDVSIGSGDGNPSSTLYAISVSPGVSGNTWVQADGSLGTSAVFQTASAWGTKTVLGLADSTSYSFSAIAQNGAGINTNAGSAGSGRTLDFAVSPTGSSAMTGRAGGPFAPNQIAFSVKNGGASSADWSASCGQAWLTVSQTSGTLNPGGTATVYVSLNAAAAGLPVGTYTDTVTFRNLTTGLTLTRAITLNVTSYAGVWFVNRANSGGVQNGASWATAYATIQQAADLALAGSEIWVASGAYPETLTLKSGVSLYGGFSGTETERDARNVNLNTTIVDATTLSSREHVVVMNSVSGTRLDGFTITGGNTTASGGCGGGIYCTTNCDATNVVSNCRFIGNVSAGTNSGSAAACVYNASPTFSHCLFVYNSGYYGTFFIHKSSPTLDACIFEGNSTGYSGAGLYCQDASTPRVLNCVFACNEASARGGAVYCQSTANAVFQNCTFSLNRAGWGTGGGVFATGASPSFRNCIFDKNAGYGVYEASADADPVLQNCLLRGNTGGGDYFDENTTSLASAAAVNALAGNSGNVDTASYFTMYGTRGVTGTWTAAPVYDAATNTTTLVDAAANFPVNALAGLFLNPNSNAFFRGNLILSNTANTVVVLGNPTGYVATGNRYYIVDLTIEPPSAAIDAGSAVAAPTTDVRGIARPQCAGYDMGAYECQLQAAFTATPVSGVLPRSVQFTDQSLVDAPAGMAWSWDFGDGGTSLQQHPSHVYETAGSFTVKLTVTIGALASTVTKEGFITVVLPTAPAAPADPGATAVGTNTITWTWTDNSSNETGFKVYDDPGSGTPSTLRITTAANAQSWQHSGLNPNTQYAFQVAATNAGADGLKTTTITAYTLAATPTAPVVSGATAHSLSVSIGSGDGNPSSTLYAISVSPGVSGNTWVQADGSLGTSAVFQTASAWGTETVVGLAEYTSYSFSVIAENGAGVNTSAGTSTSETTLDATPPVTPFAVLSASPSGWTSASSVDISFATTDAGIGGVAYALALDGGSYVPATSPYQLDVSAMGHGTHLVRVVAQDAAGNATTAQSVGFYLNYAITASAGAHGGITPSGTVRVAGGSNQPFTFTPDTGYHVSAVTVGGVPVSPTPTTSYEIASVTSDTTVEVSFAGNAAAITSVSPDTGTADDKITNARTLTLSGTASEEPGLSVEIYEGATLLGSATGTTNWTFTTPELAYGSHTFTAKTSTATSPAFTVQVAKVVADAGAERANGGLPWNAKTGTTCWLDGSGSYDPDGAVIGYAWSFDVKPAGSALSDADIHGADTASPWFTPDVDGLYTLTLTVMDSENEAYDQAATVEVLSSASNNVNAVVAPREVNAAVNEVVTLDGSQSVPAGVTYAWSATGGTLSATDASTTEFSATVEGDYTVALTVGKDENTAEDSVVVHVVAADAAPNPDASRDQVAVLQLGVDAVQLDASGSSAGACSWAFVSYPGANAPVLTGDACEPQFVPEDDGVYVLRLTVTAGAASASDAVMVTAVSQARFAKADAVVADVVSNRFSVLDRSTRNTVSSATVTATSTRPMLRLRQVIWVTKKGPGLVTMPAPWAPGNGSASQGHFYLDLGSIEVATPDSVQPSFTYPSNVTMSFTCEPWGIPLE